MNYETLEDLKIPSLQSYIDSMIDFLSAERKRIMTTRKWIALAKASGKFDQFTPEQITEIKMWESGAPSFMAEVLEMDELLKSYRGNFCLLPNPTSEWLNSVSNRVNKMQVILNGRQK